MSLLGKIITPGALRVGQEEFVGKLIGYAGLAVASVLIDKAAEYFFAPIPAEPEVVDHEETEETSQED